MDFILQFLYSDREFINSVLKEEERGEREGKGERRRKGGVLEQAPVFNPIALSVSHCPVLLNKSSVWTCHPWRWLKMRAPKRAQSSLPSNMAAEPGPADEMAEHTQKMGKQPSELSVAERNLLCVAHKNAVGSRCATWRIMTSVEHSRPLTRGSTPSKWKLTSSKSLTASSCWWGRQLFLQRVQESLLPMFCRICDCWGQEQGCWGRPSCVCRSHEDRRDVHRQGCGCASDVAEARGGDSEGVGVPVVKMCRKRWNCYRFNYLIEWWTSLPWWKDRCRKNEFRSALLQRPTSLFHLWWRKFSNLEACSTGMGAATCQFHKSRWKILKSWSRSHRNVCKVLVEDEYNIKIDQGHVLNAWLVRHIARV